MITVFLDRLVMQTDQQAVHLLDKIIGKAVEERASDIHIESLGGDQCRIRFRIDGFLQPVAAKDQTGQDAVFSSARLISRIKILAGLDPHEKKKDQDGSFESPVIHPGTQRIFDLNFRISVIPAYNGESVVIRILDPQFYQRKLKNMGYLTPVRDFVSELEYTYKAGGLFIVTGPTGSGKTTGLYAILHQLSKPENKVVTIEDPVEVLFPEIIQTQINRKKESSFARLLRAILRHDPDIILVGEIRDQQTAATAIEAAQTGHLVLTTLHTNDAISAIDRLNALGVNPEMLSKQLRGIMAQRLVSLNCPKCRQPYVPDDYVLRQFYKEPPSGIFFRGEGCEVCNGTGAYGRFVVAELLKITRKIADAIEKRSSREQMEILAKKAGMVSMQADGMKKIKHTTVEHLARIIPNIRPIGKKTSATAEILQP